MVNVRIRKAFTILLAAVLLLVVPTGCAQQAFSSGSGINIISREEGSGTRGAFVELFGLEKEAADGSVLDMTTLEASITNSTSVVINTVAGDVHAIGYISFGSLGDTIKALSIDGVAANAGNIKSGAYKIARPFNIITGGAENEAALDFIAYILSAKGQAVVEENRYIAAVEGAEKYRPAGVAGKVVVAGSSSVTPVMEKLAEAYMKLNTAVSVEIQQSDSSTGIQSVREGIAHIGMASRELKQSEAGAGLQATVIAIDGIAVIVNRDNPTSDLSAEQVRGIFSGEITTWKETE